MLPFLEVEMNYMRNTIWKVKSSNRSSQFNNFNIDQDILNILYSRGINSKKDIINFLNPHLDNIQSPNFLSDLEKSSDYIVEVPLHT